MAAVSDKLANTQSTPTNGQPDGSVTVPYILFCALLLINETTKANHNVVRVLATII
ncbi:hypothetical protein HMPREF9303_1609 [Prevotella denticola CRIS 18C-A]|uniref:Uncharacterized protein n=1 Tax=Prevotella denticola CRIS 18C-A TaxID=944557 RepID=F0H6W3_9BACT|nr:hypothetical protein HMPREF9303_1609 [Prevotella denticola CRIS 18C-A]